MADNNRNSHDRRCFPRVLAPIFYRSPRLFSSRRKVSDISIGGVRIYSDEYLKVGKCQEIEFFLPNNLSITATARVVWIEELPPDSVALYDVGLEFIDLPPHAANELGTVLEKIDSEEES